MPQTKKDLILTAATECFAKFGYKKTTLDDIGNQVGLNKASIYYYFKSKEEIFTIIVLNEFKQFISVLQQDIENKANCDQKILGYFVEKLRFWSQKSMILPQITEIEPDKLQQMMSTGQEIYLKIEKKEKSFLINILQNCIRDGHIKECDVEKVSGLLFAVADGVKDRYIGFTKNKPLTAAEHGNMVDDIQTALKIFINGLKFNSES